MDQRESSNQEEEKRNFIRASFSAQATITQGSFSTLAKILDVSIKGLHIVTQIPIPDESDSVEVTVNLTSNSSKVTLYFIADIARKTPDGYGVHMKNIDFNSFVLLRNLMGYIEPGEMEKLFSEYLNTIESYRAERIFGA